MAGNKRRVTRPRTPIEERGNLMLLATTTAVWGAVALNFRYLTPLLVAAPGYLVFLASTKRANPRHSIGLITRWWITVLVMTAVAGAFVPERVATSQLFAQSIPSDLRQWLDSGAAPGPMGWGYLLLGAPATALAALVTAGALGFVAMAITAGQTAVSAVTLFRDSRNVLEMSLLAIPPWHLAGIAALIFLVTSLSRVAVERLFFAAAGPHAERGTLQRYSVVGVALLLLAVFLRVTTSASWRELLLAATQR